MERRKFLQAANAGTLMLGFSVGLARAAESQTLDLTSAGKDPRWKVAGRSVSVAEVAGKRALRLSEGPGMGLVWLDGYKFGSGTIDIDMLGRSQPIQGSFIGVAFRVIDGRTHDAVYFRPFNFRSGDAERRAHAVQYVSNPDWPWDTLRSGHPGEYERAIVPAPDGDAWFHAQIVIERPGVSVYVNDAAAPSLAVKELSGRGDGSIGIWVGEGSGGYFANLRVTPAQ